MVPVDLRGKRIVVVGIGNSAADLVAELSQKSWQKTVYLSTRSGAWVVPKYIFGKTADDLRAARRSSTRFHPVGPLPVPSRLALIRT